MNEAAESVGFPSPKAGRKRDSGVDVNGEKKKRPARKKIQCTKCQGNYHRDDSIWIGCSKRKCNVFLHTKCAEIICEGKKGI